MKSTSTTLEMTWNWECETYNPETKEYSYPMVDTEVKVLVDYEQEYGSSYCSGGEPESWETTVTELEGPALTAFELERIENYVLENFSELL